MLMPSSASVRNAVLAMPACERMPTPTTDTLAILSPPCTSRALMCAATGLQDVERLCVVVAVHGERKVGEPVVTDVLHDHVDVDVGVADRPENLVRDAGPVGHAEDGDLGLVAVERDAGNNRLFHLVVFLKRNQCALALFFEDSTARAT